LFKNRIVIISGPTATGKSRQAIELHKALRADSVDSIIVNFDSLLFYSELNIGTAKPTCQELENYPHAMINISSAKIHLNASVYSKKAKEIIDEAHAANKVVILVGGSGFYVRALIKGMYDSVAPTAAVSAQIDSLLKSGGVQAVREMLKRDDVVSYNTIHPNDEYRNVRALEHLMTTGRMFSDEKKKMDELEPFNFLLCTDKSWRVLHLHLDMDKPEHNQIIENRSRQMMSDGLLDEVAQLLGNGFTGKEKPLGAIGYKEVVSYLQGGEISSVEECLERIIIATRQLAKAQRTWFNRSTTKIQLDATSGDLAFQIKNVLYQNENA